MAHYINGYLATNHALALVQPQRNKVENSDGSLNKIINDKELYNNLNHTAENLNLLIKDVKETPGKYFNFSVFGKKVVYKQDSVRK